MDLPCSGLFPTVSSSARFGLDIGGTLCKLVLFEPSDSAVCRELESSSLGHAPPEDALPASTNNVRYGDSEIAPKDLLVANVSHGEAERTRSRMSKLWMASHESIKLGDKGILHFKRFGEFSPSRRTCRSHRCIDQHRHK
eukprot:TRINITY_DN4003_c0_g2_i1.p1 TRINITY_DN4003_c0_g2~~TRINITY_DN4003_c0_g2_i1.p1  ORF type:complete len:140 (-),score=7.68 TRINITY_DN4003_c0_g2_i1:134-553(-)